MLIKISEASGAELDWMVAKCEGIDYNRLDGSGWTTDCFNPSTDWSQGGPIIEREAIVVQKGNPLYFPKGNEKGEYYEDLWLAGKQHGQTPLIAAMRFYVTSRLGDEVEVPYGLA